MAPIPEEVGPPYQEVEHRKSTIAKELGEALDKFDSEKNKFCGFVFEMSGGIVHPLIMDDSHEDETKYFALGGDGLQGKYAVQRSVNSMDVYWEGSAGKKHYNILRPKDTSKIVKSGYAVGFDFEGFEGEKSNMVVLETRSDNAIHQKQVQDALDTVLKLTPGDANAILDGIWKGLEKAGMGKEGDNANVDGSN